MLMQYRLLEGPKGLRPPALQLGNYTIESLQKLCKTLKVPIVPIPISAIHKKTGEKMCHQKTAIKLMEAARKAFMKETGKQIKKEETRKIMGRTQGRQL